MVFVLLRINKLDGQADSSWKAKLAVNAVCCQVPSSFAAIRYGNMLAVDNMPVIEAMDAKHGGSNSASLSFVAFGILGAG